MALPLEITIKRSGIDPWNRPLSITEREVAYDGKSIECARVVDVKQHALHEAITARLAAQMAAAFREGRAVSVGSARFDGVGAV